MKQKWPIQSILLAVGAVLSLGLGIIIFRNGINALVIIPVFLGTIILAFLIFRNPWWGFLMLIFFLPFERVPTMLLLGTSVKINTVVGFFTLFSWVLSLMFNAKRWKIQPNILAWPLGLFVIGLLLSLTQAFNLDRGLEVLAFSLFTIALSVMTVNMIPDKTTLEKVVYVLLISAGFVGLFGLFQFAGDLAGLPNTMTQIKSGYDTKTFGFPRIMAFSMEPLYFANYLLIPLALTLAYFFGHASFIKRYYLVALMVLLLVNFALTVSRGGYLGLAATLAVLMILYIRQIFTKKTVVILLVFLVVAGGVFFALSKGENRATQSFINQVTLKDAKQGSDSVQGRLKSFNFAWETFKKNPVFGIGIGNYGPLAAEHLAAAPTTGWPIVNNEFIEILVETGVVGAIGYGAIILMLLYRSLVALKYAHEPFLRASLIGLLAAFVGVMVQYNFFSTLYIIHIWILIGLLIAVQNVILKSRG